MNGAGSGSARAAGSSRGTRTSSRGLAGASLASSSTAEASGGSNVPTLSTIDDVVSYVKSAQTSLAERMLLLPALAKVVRSAKGQGYTILLDHLQGNIDPLSMLDPSIDTLGHLYILATRAAHAPDVASAQSVIRYIEHFSQVLEPEQLRGAGSIVIVFVRGIVHVAELINDHVWAMPSLLRIFDSFCRVHGGVSNLTALHPIIVYQCLRTSHYDTAYEWVIQHDIVSADTSATPLIYSDVLEYFYYAGLVCTKIGNLDAGCELFEQCVCTPAQVVSGIQIDAYKKLVLVQLLKDGSTSPLPRYTSQAVARAIRGGLSSVEPYTVLAKIIESDLSLGKYMRDKESTRQDASALTQNLRIEITEGQRQFADDRNTGLVNMVEAAFARRRIERLTGVFANISVGAIADLVGFEGESGSSAVAMELQNIDKGGKILVTLTSHATQQTARAAALTREAMLSIARDDAVAFEAVRNEHSGLPAAQRLMDTIKESQRWHTLVEAKERAIASSDAYLSKVYTSRDRFMSGGGLDDDDDGEMLKSIQRYYVDERSS